MRYSSILDYQQQTLSTEIWRGGVLRHSIKDFIKFSIQGFMESLNIENYKEFIDAVYIGSSLATFFYTESSDLDIKIVIDVKILKEHNPKFENITDEDILESLTDLGRKSFWLTAIIPGTLHVLDAYFYSVEEFTPINLLKYDSLYRVDKDIWIKEPKKLMGGYSSSYIMDIAKKKAKPYMDKLDIDIARAKRDCVDFLVLKDYIKGLDTDDLKEIYKEFYDSLESINSSIEVLIQDKDIIKDLRKREFKKTELTQDLEKTMGSINYSDGNLVFKVLQRYGYMKILSEIGDIFKNRGVMNQDIQKIINVLKDGTV